MTFYRYTSHDVTEFEVSWSRRNGGRVFNRMEMVIFFLCVFMLFFSQVSQAETRAAQLAQDEVSERSLSLKIACRPIDTESYSESRSILGCFCKDLQCKPFPAVQQEIARLLIEEEMRACKSSKKWGKKKPDGEWRVTDLCIHV